MATRLPIVRIGGKYYQLPAADVLDVPGARFTASSTPPSDPSLGDRWLDTDVGIKYTWISPGIWVDLGTAGLDFDDFVQTVGAQSIAGVKTFTEQIALPSWTTAGRPGSPTMNSIGRNTTLGCIEFWNGTAWQQEGWQIETSAASGIEKIFTLPPWAREFVVGFVGVSTNSTSAIVFQLMVGGSPETSGYSGFAGVQQAAVVSNGSNLTAYFTLSINASTAVYHGAANFKLANPATNTWLAQGDFGRSDGVVRHSFSGSKSLAGALSGARITTVSGDTFDLGTFTFAYRG